MGYDFNSVPPATIRAWRDEAKRRGIPFHALLSEKGKAMGLVDRHKKASV